MSPLLISPRQFHTRTTEPALATRALPLPVDHRAYSVGLIDAGDSLFMPASSCLLSSNLRLGDGGRDGYGVDATF